MVAPGEIIAPLPTHFDRSGQAPKLGTRLADRWITRVVRRVYLDCGIDLYSRADSHSNNIKDYLAKTTGCPAISKYRHGGALSLFL